MISKAEFVCSCCGGRSAKNIEYHRDSCPAVNNVVYATAEQALKCTIGEIDLYVCENCGFSWNVSYDPELAVYDHSYDNRNISDSYISYINDTINMAFSDIDSASSILEIGCGQGDFLQELSRKTKCSGFGFDPAYKGNAESLESVKISADYFTPGKTNSLFDGLILRHVLEHIPDPFSFLDHICVDSVMKSGSTIWIEVPDWRWITTNGTFYDITYEHCNYFSRNSLMALTARLGLNLVDIFNLFDGQYLLLKAVFPGKCSQKPVELPEIEPINISRIFEESRKLCYSQIDRFDDICIWGASGKGVIFMSDMPERLLRKVKYVVDINTQKHGRFLPVSGKIVSNPAELKDSQESLFVVGMNRRYKDEICEMLQEMEVFPVGMVFL